MIKYPTVTLFVTTYNWESALELCVNSALNQSYLPNEIIIADDGSGSKTKDLVERLNNNSPVPIIHAWQKDDGYRINAVRNMAINMSESDYIIQIDGDLILDFNFIEDHLKFAQKGRMIAGSRKNFSTDKTAHILESKKVDDIKPLLRSRFLSYIVTLIYLIVRRGNKSINGVRGCNVSYFKSDALAVNGYDEGMLSKGPNDKEFAARMHNNGCSILNLRYYACCYHFAHGEHSREPNEQRRVKDLLQKTLVSKKTWVSNGIDKSKIEVDKE